MPMASNLTTEGRFLALFLGPKHSGKTVAACSWMTPAPSQKRIKVLDVDGRIRGLLNAPWIQRDRIDYDYFPPLDKETFFGRINTELEAFKVLVDTNRSPYETFVTDSLTSLCADLLIDAVKLTHADGKGKKLGVLNMTGPEDYGFEARAIDSYSAYLMSLKVNIIVTAHVVDKYDKPMVTDLKGRTYKDIYADSVVVGEKLALRDKIGATFPKAFDHIFRFDRRLVQGEERFFVEYINDIACTSFPGLRPGQYDITGKDFREFTLGLIKASTSSNSNSNIKQEIK